MPLARIENAIDNFFNSYAGISRTSLSSAGNTYELYVYTRVLKGLAANYTVTPTRLSTRRIFKFNCGPSYTDNDNSYFELVNNTTGNKYQLRSGIQFKGHMMNHEVDVSIIPTPPTGNPDRIPNLDSIKLAIECKFYSGSGSFKSLLRQNLGTIMDLSTGHPNHSGTVVGCIHCGIQFYHAFATNQNLFARSDLMDYLRNYQLNPKINLIPYKSSVQRFIIEIENETANW